jgi:hypothetical protein
LLLVCKKKLKKNSSAPRSLPIHLSCPLLSHRHSFLLFDVSMDTMHFFFGNMQTKNMYCTWMKSTHKRETSSKDPHSISQWPLVDKKEKEPSEEKKVTLTNKVLLFYSLPSPLPHTPLSLPLSSLICFAGKNKQKEINKTKRPQPIGQTQNQLKSSKKK